MGAPGFFRRFTSRAKRVVVFASREAKEFGSRAIGPEHLFLALVREDPDLLCLFSESGQDTVGDLVQRTADLLRNENNAPRRLPEFLPLSRRACRVLQEADSQREQLEHLEVGTGHLLLALTMTRSMAEPWFVRLFKPRPDRFAEILQVHGYVASIIKRRLKTGDITPQRYEISLARELLAARDRAYRTPRQLVTLSRAETAGIDLDYYFAEVSEELRRRAFIELGDFEDLSLRASRLGARTFFRTWASADGLTVLDLGVNVFPWRLLAHTNAVSLGLLTEFSDGSWIQTVRSRGVVLAVPAAIEIVKIDVEMAIDDIIVFHEGRIQEHRHRKPDCEPRAIRSIGERHSREDRFRRALAAHRKSLGGVLTLDEISRIMPKEDQATHQIVLNEMLRIRREIEENAE